MQGMGAKPLVIRANPHRDPEGTQVSAVLAAHLKAEQARGSRAVAVHVTAALSVPLVAATVWPQLASPDSVWLLRVAWAVAAAAAAVALVVEWRWRLSVGHGAEALRSPR